MKKIYQFFAPRFPLFIGLLYALLLFAFFSPWILLAVWLLGAAMLVLVWIGASRGW